MNWITEYLKKHKLTKLYSQGKQSFSHLSVTQEAMLAIGASYQTDKVITIIKESEYQAQTLFSEIVAIDPSAKVVYYNQEESLRVEAITESDVMKATRIDALYKIVSGQAKIVITHAIASVRKLSKPEVLRNSIFDISVGDELELQDLARRLVSMGYTRSKYVDQPFTFAIRGGVCDVYSIQTESPVRIEFFDTEVDSIRRFNIEDQRSIESLNTLTIVFSSEVILSEEEIESIYATLEQRIKKESDETLVNNMEMKLELLKLGNYDASLYPLLGEWSNYATLYDYVKDGLINMSPIEGIRRTIRQNIDDVSDFFEEQYTMGEMLPMTHTYESFEVIEREFVHIDHHEYQSSEDIYLPWHKANVIADAMQDILVWLRKEAITQSIIIALDEASMERFTDTLIKSGIDYMMLTEIPKKPGIYLDYSDIRRGFLLEDINVSVYTYEELYQNKLKKYRYDNKFLQAESLTQLNDLDNADYVVHRQYGIGRYMGITTKEIDGIHKDFMRIQYRDGDELFVPLEQFSLVRKYLSSEAVAVRLSKLGTNAWQKSKDKVREDVALVADKLVNLYSDRMKQVGFAYQEDTQYQKDFEAEFEYPLTPDQEEAVRDIKKDMETALPMDRLLIGDVGFGKTEVAIRAAFKAFVDKKQVVFLCPTTILSAQHGRTFKQRFENYPITVEVLNRFVSDKEQRDIIKRVKEGKVDILIGTHRVLSQDIKFNDLGLLVIDEEQRFGVEHKERIKEMKLAVDVLSLSATPIPRTLQMSLIGLRSLSQLNTPPSNRLPVMNYVIEKNDKTIFDIIGKEIARDGQTFYLFNNVEQIHGVASKISIHIPDARVAVVHGQMDRREIEDVMVAFVAKEYNVLVCTTIIETGIDIPNANTILVDNAHRFGLSQLYQIKGRVGRSSRLAYAYFMIPDKKNITEVAQKRLQAIKEFTQLGSGYKIAMRDLTIRGAGELLGGNQSGFIDTVGIDLYVQLLKEAIEKRQGIAVEVPEEKATFNLKVDGYIPENFANDDAQKLEIYQEINDIKSLSELRSYTQSLQDRYGSLPSAITMLLEKVRLELFLADSRIHSFKERVNRIDLSFTEEFSQNVDGVHLFELISHKSTEIKIKYVDGRISITLPLYTEWSQDLIYILENVKEKEHEIG